MNRTHHHGQESGGFRCGDVVLTPSGRPAEITQIRQDGKLNARYLNGCVREGDYELTILNPRHIKHATDAHI